jgi:diaminohydroxyphosphoribosylaminopyrimidine deaminase/5-amino-6-(5-phosphoribosylamino)uracil reductase
MIDPLIDAWHMTRSLELALRGQGHVEPNPMVGCVIAQGAEIVGEGWHRRFGGPHAEVEALQVAGPRAAGATMYVTLEPCCHHGKTPPCTAAIVGSGIARVVVAAGDPFPAVSGRGVAALRAAGVAVEVGLLQAEARYLNAPYFKLQETGLPWVIAKWAMTLDGKLATSTRRSRWISGPESRQLVHRLRGRVDAIVVGRGTVEADDPLLTARPEGEAPRRTAVRVVLDSRAALRCDSQLVRTARQVPVLVVVGPGAPDADVARLESAGCEVWRCAGERPADRMVTLLRELGRRRWTNVLVEGGMAVLGSCLEAGAIDEVHVFVAPKLLGGAAAPSPIGGAGLHDPAGAVRLEEWTWRQVGCDWYATARVQRSAAAAPEPPAVAAPGRSAEVPPPEPAGPA